MNELTFIAELIKSLAPHPQMPLGPGDDTALLSLGEKGQALITTDMLMDGVHFDSRRVSPQEIGRKALAVNLSDIAAMAGKPVAAVVSLALPQSVNSDYARDLLQGMQTLAQQFEVAIAGGDTNTWSGPLVINITLVGTPHAKGPVLRSTAQPQDAILVSGTLGGSIKGKHLHFTPRIHEARFLHENYSLHALMDISDGLAGDLARILQASGVGAEIIKEAIPLSPSLAEEADQNLRLQKAMTDGEDFELLWTMPAAEASQLVARQPFEDCLISQIGTICSQPGIYWVGANQSREAMTWKGYEHKFGTEEAPE